MEQRGTAAASRVTYFFAMAWALTLLAAVLALAVGQPAAVMEYHQLADARATENTWLRATVYARPTNTPYALRCLNGQLC